MLPRITQLTTTPNGEIYALDQQGLIWKHFEAGGGAPAFWKCMSDEPAFANQDKLRESLVANKPLLDMLKSIVNSPHNYDIAHLMRQAAALIRTHEPSWLSTQNLYNVTHEGAS